MANIATQEDIDVASDTQAPRSGIAKKIHDFRHFLWNSDKKTVLGRSGKSWAQIGLFYLIFYSCLAAFFAAMLAIFLTTVKDDKPTYTTTASLLKGNPGMGFQPMVDTSSTLIRYGINDAGSYHKAVSLLEAMMKPYKVETEAPKGVASCSEEKKERSGAKRVCVFNISSELGSCTVQNKFGFPDGKPCVFLKLNKMYDWVPQVYRMKDLPKEAKNLGVKVADEGLGSVGISCAGINPADRLNQGQLDVYPPTGFAAKYFPYLNQNGYQAPLVAVQFSSMTKGYMLMMRCRLWAKNIENEDFNSREGAVRFELVAE